ncbi:unnamed protein product [marine sediment metagenome]|uniref:Uncharacterized protein n=1 Tax=marine sediment metagenome TaxID=412755 RepID=X0U398_9ZZZZ
MSYCPADEIWFLRQTVLTLQQEMKGIVNENYNMRNKVDILNHRCNDFDNSSRKDLSSIRRLESENRDKSAQITELVSLFNRLRSHQASDYVAIQEMEKRLDIVRDMDGEIIDMALASHRTRDIATSCAEQVLG